MAAVPGHPHSRMKRTKSSLLAFKLREFLDTRDDELAAHPAPQPTRVRRPTPCIAEHESAPMPFAAPTPGAGAVWVDCYFYGFYIEADKVAAFQESLREQQRLRPTGFEQQLASPVAA